MTPSARPARATCAALGALLLAGCDTTAPTAIARLVIEPITPGSAVVGDSIQRVTLQTVGGNGPATFVVASGSLPAGVTLSGAGVISGTPAVAGRFPVTVRATSGDGQTASIDLELVVRERIAIATTALPGAVRCQAYSAGLTATGADSVYTWFVDAGALPPGLSLSSVGFISGVPSEAQIAQFTARVRSGDGQTTVQEFTVAVSAPFQVPALSISTSILPPGLAGSSYRPLLSFSGGDCSQVTWSVVGGSLPPGVTLSASGLFTGSPTVTGTYSFTAQATNGGQSDQKGLSIRVVPDDTGRFNITRVDVVTVSPEIDQHVQAAITRWEDAIRGDLINKDIGADFLGPEHCAGFGSIPNGASVDDIIVMVNIATIDGPSKILGEAAPCAIRDDVLPLVGILTLDDDDVSTLVGTQKLTDVVFHEIGHVLGFGTLWDTEGFHYVTGSGSSDPRFTGSQGVAEWQALGGTGNIPLADDAHWRESIFGTELMTAFVSPVGTPNPFSRLTLAAMADLGFSVDYSAVDAYQLPIPTLLSEAPGEPRAWDVVSREPIPDLAPRRLHPHGPPVRSAREVVATALSVGLVWSCASVPAAGAS